MTHRIPIHGTRKPPWQALESRPMKRKYGKAKNRETLAEQRMREAAAQMRDNRHNFGSQSRKGAITRGKIRSRSASRRGA